MEQQFFILLALVAIGTALLVVIARNPIHSALSLVACFVQIAALFVLLGSPFLAVIQLFVYVGAIMVLFLFVIMMLDIRKETHGQFINNSRFIQKGAIASIVALLALASELLFLLSQSSRLHAVMVQQNVIGDEPTKQLSLTLFRDFLLPFEVASVILLVALVGAVVLAKSDRPNRRLNEHKQGATKEVSK